MSNNFKSGDLIEVEVTLGFEPPYIFPFDNFWFSAVFIGQFGEFANVRVTKDERLNETMPAPVGGWDKIRQVPMDCIRHSHRGA